MHKVDSAVNDSFSPPAALSSRNSTFSPVNQSPRIAEIAWEPALSQRGIFYSDTAE